MWDNLIYVEHCAVFGLVSAGGIQGAIADALLDILASKGFGLTLKWVDDFVFFRSPLSGSIPSNPSFPFNLASILAVSAPLGIPWHPVSCKGQDFQTSIVYVGFLWDLAACTVSLPDAKWLKVLHKVSSLLLMWNVTVSCKDTTSVLGTLQHIVFVY
jgi:hypothetical protein